MVIKRMKASFGQLEARELFLDDGLNVIYAPNESGKSTWCAFIRAMLYGVDTAERARAGHMPDKLRYAPWSGAPMEGEMDIVHGGREITLIRTGRPNTPMRELRAVYTGTAEPVPGLTAENLGEVLAGAPRAVFERSAFVRQAGVGVTGSPELGARIAAIVSSGDEDASFEEVDGRLRAWQRHRKYRSSGILPELETEMRAKALQLADLEGASRRRAELEASLKRAEDERDAVLKRLEASRRERRAAALSGMAETQREVAAREEVLAAAREDVLARRAELLHGVFGDEPPEDVEEAARGDAHRAEELRERAGAKAGAVLPAVLSALCLAAAVAGLILMNVFLFIAAGLLLAGAVFTIVRAVRRRRAAETAAAELRKILDHYAVADPRGIMDALSIHAERWEACEAAAERRTAAERALQAALGKQRALQGEVLTELNFQTGGSAESVALTAEFTAAEEAVRRLRDELSAAGGRISVLGDPMALRSELGLLEARKNEKTAEYEALTLAIDVLREAHAEIQARFSPALSRRAGEIFAAITGGKYSEARFDRELDAVVRAGGDAVPRNSLFLSEGARNALYLSLRLAICELALPEGEPCPLILDDALVTLDNERAKNAVDFLRETARGRQVILFTCHGREARWGECKECEQIT